MLNRDDLFQKIITFGSLPRRSREATEEENTLAEKVKNFRRNHTFTPEQDEALQRLQHRQDQGGENVSMSRSRGGPHWRADGAAGAPAAA